MADLGNAQDDRQAAMQLFAGGYLMEARQACEAVLKSDPADSAMLCLLGAIFGSLNQYSKAAEFLRDAIRVSPGFLDAHYNLAIVLRQLGELDEADRELDYVVSNDAGNADAFYMLGLIRLARGEHDQAIECYRTARQLDPEKLQALAGEAEVYEKQGMTERAFEVIQPHVVNGLHDAQIAIVYGKLAVKLGISGEVIELLETFLDTYEIDKDARLKLHFILGEMHDEAGNYNAAFNHYREGNQLKGVYFDAYRYRFDIDQQIDKFSAVNLSRLPLSNIKTDLPLFIVGMPRSGTSLVEQILSSHNDVYGAGELANISKLVEPLSRGKRYGNYEMDFTTMLTVDQLSLAANSYLDHLRELAPTALRVTDKMPGNFHHLGYIKLMFPDARIIHCRRNAIDTCLSCYFQNFAGVHDYAFRLEDLAEYFLGYLKLMEHWQDVLGLQIYEVQYEEMVGNPENEIRRLLEFCGLEWDEQCLRHDLNRRVIRTASYKQASQPIYKQSVMRWRHYAEHVGPLVDVLADVV